VVGGIPCPECGSTVLHKVIDTRRRKGWIHRRRECACGERFSTTEVIGRGRLNPRDHTKCGRKDGCDGDM